MVVSGGNPEELRSTCEFIMWEFVNWCRSNNLMVNVDKTVCVYFSIKNNEVSTFSLKCGDNTITTSETTKFLGIHVDRNLRWTTHIDVLCKKLNSSVFAIARIRNVLPRSSVMSVYYSLVYSHLSYNILLWGSSPDFSRVFVAQKRVLRTIFNLNMLASCKPVFIGNGILTLPSIYIFKCLLYAKENEDKWMKLSSHHNYVTRNTQIFLLPKRRTHKFECSPLYRSIKLYNHLPPSVKSLNLKLFKKEIKNLLLKKGFYSVNEYLCDSLVV